jgi:hypothetical protein
MSEFLKRQKDVPAREAVKRAGRGFVAGCLGLRAARVTAIGGCCGGSSEFVRKLTSILEGHLLRCPIPCSSRGQ